MLKLRSNLTNVTFICLNKSTAAKFHPSAENNRDLQEKIREDMVGRPSTVFKRKAVVDETFSLNSTIWCTSNVGIDARQLHPFSMCQAMSTGL